MSDRVAVIGGSIAGRDHFPYPINRILDFTGDSGEFTNYPLIVDLDTACRWWYLVRAWRLDLTIGWDKYVNGVFSSSGSSELSVVLEPNVYDSDFNVFQPTRESDLLYDRRIGYFFNVVQSDDPDADYPPEGDSISDYSDDLPIDFGLQLSLSMYFGIPKFLADQFYFRFRFAFGSGGEASRSSVTSDDDLGDGTIGSIDVDGKTVSLSVGNDPSGLGTEYIISSCDTGLAPEVFWPYATKSGEPVYDTATGEQLADPLS